MTGRDDVLLLLSQRTFDTWSRVGQKACITIPYRIRNLLLASMAISSTILAENTRSSGSHVNFLLDLLNGRRYQFH